MKYNPVKTAAYSGIVSALAFTVLFVLAAFNYGDYDVTSNFLSDLGRGTPAFFFNSGLAVSGFLGMAFGYGMTKISSKIPAALGAKMLIVASASLFGVGIFPEQYGIIHVLVPFAYVLTGLPAVEHTAVFGLVAWEFLTGVYLLRKADSQNL